jgi:hypothetical protein
VQLAVAGLREVELLGERRPLELVGELIRAADAGLVELLR